MPGKRRFNPRLVKTHRTYTLEEAARCFDVHRNTVRNWVRAGLRLIDDRRPSLIQGEQLQRFLTERRAAARRPCKIGEIYCVRCREPRRPAGEMADFTLIGATIGTLKGLCPDCGTIMHRRVAPRRLSEISGNLDVRLTDAAPHLGETPSPSASCAIPGSSAKAPPDKRRTGRRSGR